MRNEIVDPFFPGTTVSLAVTTSTGNVSLTGADGKGKRQLRLYNAGSVAVFIRIGVTGVVAAVTDMPIPPGAVEVITLRDASGQMFLAGITASSTATLYATVGEGV